jgi:hypothetical protein
VLADTLGHAQLLERQIEPQLRASSAARTAQNQQMAMTNQINQLQLQLAAPVRVVSPCARACVIARVRTQGLPSDRQAALTAQLRAVRVRVIVF